MKTSVITAACIAALLLMPVTPACADVDDGVAVAADVLVVRPACLIATVVGSAFFIVALPVAATSKSVKQTARTLVVKPAKMTFTRPLGDMEVLQ